MECLTEQRTGYIKVENVSSNLRIFATAQAKCEMYFDQSYKGYIWYSVDGRLFSVKIAMRIQPLTPLFQLTLSPDDGKADDRSMDRSDIPESTVMQILHMIVAILTLCYLVHIQVLDGTVQIRFPSH
jgi:hypothetical protein